METMTCSSCKKKYPRHDGIPDFRVFPDPYLDFEEDRKRTEIVLAGLKRHNLESLLKYYWSFSDITPEFLRRNFIRSALLGEQRAQRIVRLLENGTFNEPVVAASVLEIGCGTGNFLTVAVQHYKQVIGIDIAMRWLHASRRRFMDSHLPVSPLVCCCAEYLPFPDGMFDLIVTSSTLEFARDPSKVLSECARVLKANGSLLLNTVNRFSLARDPYAYLWGVGFLPRAWQARYVQWWRNASYENIRLLSFRKLNKMAAKYFAIREFVPTDIDDQALSQFSRFVRLQVHIYRRLKRLPLFAFLLKWVGPGWDAKLGKGSMTS